MEKTKGKYQNAWPYQKDKMQLPVANLDKALPFYKNVMGFHIDSIHDTPVKSAVLSRDEIQMGLAENGGDPSQDGCFIEVENVETALNELHSNGYNITSQNITQQKHGETTWKVFFVVAPDGLCYCIGQKI